MRAFACRIAVRSSMASTWTCAACEYDENEAAAPACDSCGEAAPTGAPAASAAGPLIVCGLVLSLEPVPGKDKLRALTVDVGAAAPVALVSTAPNLAVGARVVVALPGAVVPVDGADVTVKAATVGGVRSAGMLCDAPMLSWVGGGAGLAALLPDAFAPGAPPPAVKPRLK